MGGIFALLAALGFTFDNILIRRGLMEESPGNVWDIRLVSNLTSVCIFFMWVSIAIFFSNNFIQEFRYISFTAVLVLMLSGVLGPLIGALLMATAIGQIGPSHASALWGGSNPLFAALLAFVFLGELPNLIGMFSVLIIAGGIIVIGYHGHAGTVMLLKKTKLAGGVIALLSGLCFAFSHVGRGVALNLGATPNTAFFIFHTTALIITTIVCFKKSRSLKYIKHISRKSLYCYAGSGIGVFVGSYGILIAFTLIPVWQAVAIRNIQPVLVIYFSWVFLKKVDNINLRLVLGAVLVTIGVVILNVYPS